MTYDRFCKVVARQQYDAILIFLAIIGTHTGHQRMHDFAVFVLPDVRAVRQAHGPQMGEKCIVGSCQS